MIYRFTFSRQSRIWSFHAVALYGTEEKSTRNHSTHAQSLFCLNLLLIREVAVTTVSTFDQIDIYTRLLHEEKIFPMTPRSELSEPAICTKMLKMMSEKLRAKFLATTPSCSMVKIGRLNDSLLEVF